ncbi:MAG: hypothetical protein GXY42_00110 [Desulfovibrionales bacterium]|nr:hypothetical protein [Desulfovibrionales bacterium]
MRTALLTALAALLFAGSVLSEEREIEKFNPCSGTWVLQHRGEWVVTRQEDGLTKSIPSNATILDCGERPGTLKEHMDNVKAVVRCTNATDQNGGFHVYEIQIVCE